MTKKKITKLTPEQEALIPVFREKWLKIGRCCDPADFKTGDRVISGFYRRIGKEPPPILHFASPAACEIAANIISKSKLDLKSPNCEAIVSEMVEKNRGMKAESLFIHNSLGGQHWCSWESFYLFMVEIGVEFNPEDLKLLNEWAELASSIGWWAPWENICIVSDRPRAIHLDDQSRLHNEKGKAVRYSDEWGISCWHGTRVPNEWLGHNPKLTPEIALGWPHGEQRRCACEILGWVNILGALNSKTIDEDGDPEIGKLVEVDLPGSGKEKFLIVLCGTKRQFALPVPREMKTALQAQAWGWELDEKNFVKPEFRT